MVESYACIGDKIKSGRVSVADNTWISVNFAKNFKNIPNVVLTLEDYEGTVENCSVRNITVSGFEVHQESKTPTTKWIQWIATDIGNTIPEE